MNAFWSARTAHERQVLATGAVVVAALLLLALVWLPLERARTRFASEIPQLTSALATMERQAAEVARVRSMPAVAGANATPPGDAATAVGRALPSAQVTLLDAKRVRIAATDVAYGTLLEAVAAAQSAQGLRVDTARVEALPAAGRVRAEIVLARP